MYFVCILFQTVYVATSNKTWMMLSTFKEFELLVQEIPHYFGKNHSDRIRTWTKVVQLFVRTEMQDQLFRANHWMLESPLHEMVSSIFKGTEN
jgi:hypothetical protein